MNVNESIVHEWSVLYTNRIFQRDKKWCDGKLKYYVFNNKVEVSNEDDQLIEVDFITPKFASNFTDGKQVRLPGNRIIVEIDTHLSTYSRDISELSKRVKREHASVNIKKEPIQKSIEDAKKPTPKVFVKEEPTTCDTPLNANAGSVRAKGSVSSLINGRSSNAASIRVKKEIYNGSLPAPVPAAPADGCRPKVPASDARQLHAIKKDSHLPVSRSGGLKIEKTNHSINLQPYKKPVVAKQGRPPPQATRDPFTSKKQSMVPTNHVPSSIIRPAKVRKRQRIPPKSSSIFKYLGSCSLDMI